MPKKILVLILIIVSLIVVVAVISFKEHNKFKDGDILTTLIISNEYSISVKINRIGYFDKENNTLFGSFSAITLKNDEKIFENALITPAVSTGGIYGDGISIDVNRIDELLKFETLNEKIIVILEIYSGSQSIASVFILDETTGELKPVPLDIISNNGLKYELVAPNILKDLETNIEYIIV